MISQKEIHIDAVQHGFWNTPTNIAEKLCLIHSEISEALEADRSGYSIGEELADAVIRILDLSEHLGIDLNMEIKKKHKFNKSRPYKHSKRY